MSQIQESEATYAEISPINISKERYAMEENECYGGLKVAPQRNAGNSEGNKCVTTALVVLMMLVVLLTLAVAACCITFAMEIAKLKSETVSAEQEQNVQPLSNH